MEEKVKFAYMVLLETYITTLAKRHQIGTRSCSLKIQKHMYNCQGNSCVVIMYFDITSAYYISI